MVLLRTALALVAQPSPPAALFGEHPGPEQPVMLQGTAEVITDWGSIAAFLAASNAKYAVNYQLDFLDPAVNATVRVAPRTVIGLKESDFGGSPTRWRFFRVGTGSIRVMALPSVRGGVGPRWVGGSGRALSRLTRSVADSQ